MLQPREQIFLRPFCIVLCILIISFQTGFAQYSDNVYIVEPTPALKLSNQDELTTVLLLNNNNNRGTLGRFLNVKPTVGLLTSTARTFIQEGVTTEYATQVLGTTLDNGRLYAQLLKKSSRVLYDKESPTDISPTGKFPGTVQTLQTFSPNPKTLLQSHNDIVGDQDWQLIDDHLLLVNKQNYNNLNTYVRNTDFISPIDSPQRHNAALLVFPTQSYNNRGIDIRENVVGEKFPNQTYSVSHSSSSSSSSNGDRNIIDAQRVLHAGDLPTFTIKNMFAPSGFSWNSPIDDIVDQQTERISKVRTEQLRAPKLLQHDNHVLQNDLRNLPTVTYYGFAEFTTLVGDTVIVFSPSTSTVSGNQGQVTSITGEATLNDIPLATAFVSHVPNTVPQELIEPTVTLQQAEATIDQFTPPTSEIPTFHQREDSQPEEEHDNDLDLTELTMPDLEDSDGDSVGDDDGSDEEYSTTTEQDFIDEDTTPQVDSGAESEETIEEIPVLVSAIVVHHVELEPSILSVDVTETSTTMLDETATKTSTKVMLSKPSNEDISKIFASLASIEVAKKLAAQQSAAEEKEETTESATTATTSTPITTTTTENSVESDEGKDSERKQTEIENIRETTTTTTEIVETPYEQPEQEETSPETPPTEEPQEQRGQPDILESIGAETKISGGITTIFFEDDPFKAFEATPTQHITPPISTITTSITEEAIIETTTDTTSQSDIMTTESDTNVTEHNEISDDENCQHHTAEIVPSLIPKTLTYLTTFFISDAQQTSMSVESNIVVTFDVSYSTKFNCAGEIAPTHTVELEATTTNVDLVDNAIERPIVDEPEIITGTPEIVEEVVAITTAPSKIVTEKTHVTTEEPLAEANSSAQDADDDSGGEDDEHDEEDNSQQSEEEIELIYKTLYTTYTYLTTFFHESTTSVSSRKEILTNVITSTVNPSQLKTDLDVTKLLASISPTATTSESDSMATSIGTGRPTTKFQVQESDLVRIDDILREDEEHISPTASLNDQLIQTNAVKTYYTTYTYFTTIFVDGETEITSRTEIYTNYVTGSAYVNPTVREEDTLEYTVRDDDNNVLVDITPTSTYETILKTTAVSDQAAPVGPFVGKDARLEEESVVESSFVSSSSSSSVDENQITMVTDVRSSSSDGDRHIIENVNRQWNGLLEDQISSESNTEDILPSSTLLLQTSYTTFTYFTTMYIGNTASNILSRLETITNVVTETLQRTKTVSAEDSSLPVTYFTTFTYWTTLYKDGEITTISREETVSNIVTPTTALDVIATTEIINPSSAKELVVAESSIAVSESDTVVESVIIPTITNIDSATNVENATTNVAVKATEHTTFYTTYTYFTTSYVGEETVLNSRFETVTNIVTPVPEPLSSTKSISPILQPALSSSVANVNATPIALETITEPPTPAPILDNQIIGLNEGKIIDAEGISTLFYTTKTIATRINNELTHVVTSSSSLNIDEEKKALSTSEVDPSSRTYRTGLVRLIDGTMIANRTTTLYQSKVIGTVIEGRYAQIIESTSSFLIEKTLSPPTVIGEISATAVQTTSEAAVLQTAFTPIPSADAVEGSISDGAGERDEQFGDDDANDDEDEDNDGEGSVDENGRSKSRLTFQSKKRTFTPVIRPFASRNRHQFAPKRKNSAPGSATIITRSDITPTITATPALKSDSSRGRFSSNRKSSSAIFSSPNALGASRKFSRTRSSAAGGFVSSSAYPGGNSRKGLSSSRIQPSSSLFGLSSRRGGASSQRGFGSSSSIRGFSSAYPGNSRLRIKPTSTVPSVDAPNTNVYTTQEPEADDDITQANVETEVNQEEEEIETTTEGSRRQNPLLKFRRPPIVGRNLAVSQRRNPLTQRSKTTTTTTTTAKPRPRAFQRPSIAPFQSRPRPASSLFPPRGLFRPQTINQDLDEQKKQQDEDNNDFGDDLNSDNEYDDDEDEEDDEEELERNRRDNSKSGHRVKRQVSSFRNRFRRPTPASKSSADERSDMAEESTTQRSRTTARYTGSRSNGKKATKSSGSSRIRPTKASSSSRAQFTLREKDTVTKSSRASSFRRPTISGISSPRRTATTIGRPKAPRLKSFSNAVTETPYTSRSTAGRSRQTTSRGRSTTRSRTRTTEYQNNDPVLPVFDGTITVTHHIPTEITIPVVNGKVTEYKNVVTAQVRTEVLVPNQYNTLIDRTGSSLLVLAREESTINNNGATEITQFILHETPTTSVIFTPTTIRGRRTSFSHIIPSTVYDVENVVSTIQPQIAAQAPFANILLSQLLLGNIGIQQQQLNPLIGLGGQPQVPSTPTTEFNTRTTTYVTTVTNEMSTVIPLTFRGKEILTTIVDSSVNVITATEFITDTIVVTPTMGAVQQVNSLLLPLLLQQQAQGQQNQLLPIQNSILPQHLTNDGLLTNPAAQQQNLFQDASFRGGDLDRIQKVNLDDFRDVRESEEFPEQETFREPPPETMRSRKRNHRKGHKPPAAIAAVPSPTLDTSVVTLYVSGRRPGEFSTVLSTVVGQDSSLRKRHATFVPVEKSAIVDYDDLHNVDESEINEYLLPATNDIGILAYSQLPSETQSLESIVGDVSRWFELQSEDTSVINQSPITSTSGAIEKTTTREVVVMEQPSQQQNQPDDQQHFLV